MNRSECILLLILIASFLLGILALTEPSNPFQGIDTQAFIGEYVYIDPIYEQEKEVVDENTPLSFYWAHSLTQASKRIRTIDMIATIPEEHKKLLIQTINAAILLSAKLCQSEVTILYESPLYFPMSYSEYIPILWYIAQEYPVYYINHIHPVLGETSLCGAEEWDCEVSVHAISISLDWS
jgi:hypothetical protein